MVFCSLCDRYFGSDQAFWQHVNNSVRHECSFCYFRYEDHDEYLDHLDSQHERCGICNLWVADDGDAMHDHRLRDHAARYCSPCRRIFIGSSNLQAHLNSSLHRPKTIPCPHKSRGCTQFFVSHSAMTLHLESGHCVSGFTRADVNRRVIELDRGRVICDPSRLLTNGGTPAQYFVTDQAWNGYAWECYLCHAKKGSRQALNSHLNSPRHEEKMYFCPQTQCAQRFTTLSGLMQHIEIDRCGVQRFQVVQQAIAQLTNGMRRLGQ